MNLRLLYLICNKSDDRVNALVNYSLMNYYFPKRK